MTYKEWKGIHVDKPSTMDEWNTKHVDKSAESGIINAYPGKSDSHQANEISQTIKAKVAEAESTVVRDIPSLSGWHEPIAYLAAFSNESFDEIQSICKTELGTMTYCNPHELIAQSFGNYYFGKKKSNVAKRIVKMFKRELR